MVDFFRLNRAYEEEEVDELGFFKPKTVLGKYDEEIEGEAINRFTIGDRGRIDTSWETQKESMKQVRISKCKVVLYYTLLDGIYAAFVYD